MKGEDNLATTVKLGRGFVVCLTTGSFLSGSLNCFGPTLNWTMQINGCFLTRIQYLFFFELTMFSWFTCHFNTLFHLVIAGTTSVFGTMQSSVSSQTNVKTGKTTRPLSFYAFKEKVTVVFRTKKKYSQFRSVNKCLFSRDNYLVLTSVNWRVVFPLTELIFFALKWVLKCFSVNELSDVGLYKLWLIAATNSYRYGSFQVTPAQSLLVWLRHHFDSSCVGKNRGFVWF